MAKKQTLTVHYVPGLPGLPIYVADHLKIFQKHGLDPELTNVGGDFGGAVHDVAEGKVDLTFVAFFFVQETAIHNPGSLLVLQHNLDVEATPTVYGLVVRKDSKIRKPKDLKGKTVAVFPAQAPGARQSLFEAYVHSLAENVDARPINTNPFAGVEALAKGDVDALLTLEPIASIGAAQIGGRLVGETPMVEVLEIIPTGAAVVSRKRYESDPGFTQKIRASLDEAVDYIRATPDVVTEVYPKYGCIPEEFKHLGKQFVLSFWKSTEIRRKEIRTSQAYADYLKENGVLTGGLDVRTLYLPQRRPRDPNEKGR